MQREPVVYMPNTMRKRGLAVFIFVGITLGFMLAGLALNDLIVQASNKAQLARMSSQLLSRTELAVDYAIITLGELMEKGAESCDINAPELLRESIASRGPIKNILVVDELGNVRCSGLPINGRFAEDSSRKSFPSRNEAIVLQKADGEPNGVFQVAWNVGFGDRFVAILNVDMLLFDVFPAEIRDRAQAVVNLGGATEIAGYRPGGKTLSDTETLLFESKSDRFAISVQLCIDPSDASSWNDETRPLAAAVAGLLGVIVAVLVVKLLLRPLSEMETLRLAIRRGEIQPHFQPIFAINSLKIVGCEVLVRWIRDGVVVSPPDRFIPLAEHSGLIVQLTDTVMTDALLKLAPLLKKDHAFKVAFNITPQHFVADNFLEWLNNKLKSMNVSHSNVVIELTERQAFADTKKAANAAIAARKAGFRIALDDTGSGHNGLSYVQELPVDIIKIDKKFVDLVHRDQAASSIVKMLVALATELGMTTVAEGVETEVQAMTLRELGVSEGQGYFMSPAVPLDRFLALMDGNSIDVKSLLVKPLVAAA